MIPKASHSDFLVYMLLSWNYIGLVDFDLDGDWDPEKHDRQMVDLFGEEGQEEVRIFLLENYSRHNVRISTTKKNHTGPTTLM